jgi:hypothetical protein
VTLDRYSGAKQVKALFDVVLQRRMLDDGLAANRRQLGRLLAGSLARASSRPETIASLLTVSPSTAGETAFARSIAPSQIAAVIFTLVDQGAVHTSAATTALLRDTVALERPSGCTASGRKAIGRTQRRRASLHHWA